ncbi:4-hydroxyproline epimerase [Poseidonibacter lekithochrous]|uniref:4-hydroxyproline epimerase n=1 Tax=Poseidonibacter lekithochrous TaxID=1904463 RepID=UPI0008FCCBC7|nr:4-hydroxyproline epimerase [Poseidonibacter lekithochrous]QKJ21780.1 hydroxyproline-2-epimerase [Poseidonibacter lekithochrous]
MSCKTFFCVDAHTCGNPVRVICGGAPLLKGKNMSEKRQHFLKEFDWIRRGLMFEPRGHDMMSGTIVYEPSSDEFDVSILFIETSGCLPMCGHGTIGTVTVLIEKEIVTPKVEGTLRIETPAGLVVATYKKDEKNRVKSVKIVNIASFLHSTNLEIESSTLGKLKVDVAYGGNFYAIVDPQENFTGIENFKAGELISMSGELREKLNEKYSFVHPLNETICGLSHIEWTGKTIDESSSARNAVFYGDKAIDRSPCGTGTSARMAQWYAKGDLTANEEFIHESFIGSKFIGRIEDEVELGSYKAIIPSIEGWAKITGLNTITIDDDDPYAHGFQVI